MKDASTTIFGYIIAYVLPGLFGLITISFWSGSVRLQFEAFTKAEANVGLFFVVALVALLIGVELTAVRWLIFEVIWFRKRKLAPASLAALTQQSKSDAFRVVVDEHYRYHQFWGGLVPVIPFFAIGLFGKLDVSWQSSEAILICAGSLGLLALTTAAAGSAFGRYLERAEHILGGT